MGKELLLDPKQSDETAHASEHLLFWFILGGTIFCCSST